MIPVSTFGKTLSAMAKTDIVMPALFIGHGSPMNGIEDNQFSREWAALARRIPKPQAIIVVSAHWLTRGTWVTAMEHPRTIHDFSGFPKALHQVQYNAPGSPQIATDVIGIIRDTQVQPDHEWGLDHGAWTVLRQMYPDANIPIVQLSIDYHKPPDFHYRLAEQLAEFRRRGVLIIGSGNMVHNLSMVAWDKLDQNEYGYDWALEMNETFKKKIQESDHHALLNYRDFGSAAQLAVPTPDHYYPLLYALGLQNSTDHVEFFNDKAVGGSLTMTSVLISPDSD